MATKSAKPSLTRDPEDWARDNGWISRRRAQAIRRKLEAFAWDMEGEAFDNALDSAHWCRQLRKLAIEVAPIRTPAQRRRDF